MKKTMLRPAGFAFYDQKSIETHLEKMAGQGWMIEKLGTYLWKYRKIEPKAVHVSVTYVADSSVFDPGPTVGQRELEEFCAQDHWILAAHWGQMQIFYSEQDNPTPIETDPVTQVENIHRAIRKNQMPSAVLMLLLSCYVLFFWSSQFRRDPSEFLSEKQ